MHFEDILPMMNVSFIRNKSSRLTDQRIDITEEVKQNINVQLRWIEEHIKERPIITVTYFVPDQTKDGGSYRTLTAPAIKIDTYDERLRLEDDITIVFDDIIYIESI